MESGQSWLPFNGPLTEEIAARMDLRRPNAQALRAIAEAIASGDGREVVCDLATGVGKTYISAALLDYLATQGVRNILIVTPGKTIQDKTVANFTPGNAKFVSGGEFEPVVITSDNFSRGQVADALTNPEVVKLFIFNVQQLIRPSAKVSRKVRDADEFIGSGLYEHLENTGDLVVIADEHHVYRESARAFGAAIRELNPRALVGLTATPDEADLDKVIYRYSLAEAIADGLVKIPVIVYRQDGLKTTATQLADACLLREAKEVAWRAWAQANTCEPVVPVLFVVCKDVSDAELVSLTLASAGHLPGAGQVLLITSQSSDDALRQLAAVEDSDSKVRAVVSVNKLKEGWDVKNIGVIVGLRALASQTLTEQILGRGLRLPYGNRVGNQAVDTVDLVAHDSYKELLAKKDALLQAILKPNSASTAAFNETATALAQRTTIEEDAGSGSMAFVIEHDNVEHDAVSMETFLQVASFESVRTAAAQASIDVFKTLKKVDGAPDIYFPRREVEMVPERFSLSLIRDADAEKIGRAYLDDPAIYLTRVGLTARRTADDEIVLGREFLHSERASLRQISAQEVRNDLETRVLALGLVESTMSEFNASNRVISAFLRGAGVVGEESAPWSEQRARLAVRALQDLVLASYQERRRAPSYRFNLMRVPVLPPPPMPSPVADYLTTSGFQRKQWYGGWQNSIEPVASFDAKSTEFALAENFDASANGIAWWLRTYTNGEVWIESNSKRYYPDFIVIDDDNVHWIVEGKADDDAFDTRVQQKKRAAEDWARSVRDSGQYGVWRYLFATESTIRQAAGSWANLKRIAQPEL